jgi:hypothetical protein
MPAVLTSIGVFKQSITGGAFASDALAACSGDSLSILNFAAGSGAYVEEIWTGNSANKMEVALFGARFGDPIYGLRMQHEFNPTLSGADGEPQLILPRMVDIPVYRGDTLTMQVNGTATNNVNAVLQVYYENLEGADARLTAWPAIQNNVERYISVEVTVTPGTTGNYGTAVALNANDDRLVGDYDYAVLGYTVDQPVLSIGIKGPDTGQYRIAFPGHWDARHTADWFVQQSAWRNKAHIPVISALNKAGTFLDGLSASNAGATKVSLFLAQLRAHFVG